MGLEIAELLQAGGAPAVDGFQFQDLAKVGRIVFLSEVNSKHAALGLEEPDYVILLVVLLGLEVELPVNVPFQLHVNGKQKMKIEQQNEHNGYSKRLGFRQPEGARQTRR